MGKNKPETIRKWRRLNPEKVRAYKKKYHANHPDQERVRVRLNYDKNREKILQMARARRLKNHAAELKKQRARRTANPEKYREMNRAHKQANPYAWRLYSARKQAKAKGLAFDLDLEWFATRLDSGICELSGLPFDLREKYGLGGRGARSPSVDRRDPKGPYTKENCRMILWWINRALTDLGEEYAFSVFRAIFVKRGEMAAYEDRMAA